MTIQIDLHDEFTKEVFEYLDDLRASGDTNMSGAGPYVEDAFGLDRATARQFVKAWMKNFETND